ncbi:MAG: hypothetical protein FD165_301 [Gammaproteobacteria bacterium]|nr:MAG: hypothetical protein FD165_301 [Gammaproteobacteria bacterium]TND06880.1 MAG: hypothetical protein FD120_612 [Gammaproteobacteria bacterium]
MLDQDRVRSGFDIEMLLGERFLSYTLLTLVDAGSIPVVVEIADPPLQFLLAEPSTTDRLYESHPDAVPAKKVSEEKNAFEVEILFDHPSGADVRVHAVFDFTRVSPPLFFPDAEFDLFVRLVFDTHRDDDGALDGATLSVALVDIASPLLPFALTQGITKEAIMERLTPFIDRDLDLGGVGAFKRLQDLGFRKLPAAGNHPAAFGLYLNLLLQTGPEPDSLLDNRGSVDDAINFLPEGSDVAMATRKHLYGVLSNDAYNRRAELNDLGTYSWPLRKSPSNPKSKKIGTLNDITIAPLVLMGPNGPVPTNTLRIDISGEYEIDDFFDPDFHILIDLTPITDGNGLLGWNVETGVDIDLLFEILPFLGFYVLLVLFGGAGLMASGIIAGILFTLGEAAGLIADAMYSERIQDKTDAAMPDVVTGRVAIARRRWDPFYTTLHQVAIRPDGAIVNATGIAIWGRAAIDKQVQAVEHIVIRDEQRVPPEAPTHLRYRVYDAASHLPLFSAFAPGTDRRSFEQHDPTGEPDLYQLSIDQILERFDEKRLISNIPYVAKRIDLRQNQVDQILCLSQREINEQRNTLLYTFEVVTRPQIEGDEGAQIRAEVIAEFMADGITPTEEEIVARVDERIDEILAEREAAYVEAELDAELEAALLPVLRFDLPPEHLAALQKKGILNLKDFEIIGIRKHHPPGAPLLYYRDHPDAIPADNLLLRPHYTAGPTGPVFPP